MTDLSVIREVAIETLHNDHTVVISTSGALTLICTMCGGLKSTTTYVGTNRDAWLNGTRTCSCNASANARNPGGDELNETMLSHDEHELLAYLYDSKDIEELRLKIPAPHLHDTYSLGFYDLLGELHQSPSIQVARHVIRKHLPGEGW